MDAIQAALNSRISTPAGIASGEGLIWDGAAWQRSSDSALRFNNGGSVLPKVTMDALSAGPPASPLDGDIWFAHDVDANGAVWQFRYNAGSLSAYKWEFVGGSPLMLTTKNGNGWAGGAWNDIVGPIVAPRAGDYIVDLTVSGQNTSGGSVTFEIGVGIGVTNAVHVQMGALTYQNAWDYSLGGSDRITVPAAGTNIYGNGFAASLGSAAPGQAQMKLTPVRVD